MTLPAPLLTVGIVTADLTVLGAKLEIRRGKSTSADVDVMDRALRSQSTVGPAFAAALASSGSPVVAHSRLTRPATPGCGSPHMHGCVRRARHRGHRGRPHRRSHPILLPGFDTVPHDLFLKAVEHHIAPDQKWILLHVRRLLQAPLQKADGTLVARDQSREVQVRFCETRGVRFPPATHRQVQDPDMQESGKAGLRRAVAYYFSAFRMLEMKVEEVIHQASTLIIRSGTSLTGILTTVRPTSYKNANRCSRRRCGCAQCLWRDWSSIG